MSIATLGYTAGAAILWVAGMVGLADWAAGAGSSGSSLGGLLVPGALLWTVAIAGYLVWASLTRRDERRFLAVLERSYRRES